LDEIGVGGERLEFFHIAASEAPLFAETVTMMTERARNLGPNPYRRMLQKMRKSDKE
jgi:coenzyme F420-reducing hydrogenase delta subunit